MWFAFALQGPRLVHPTPAFSAADEIHWTFTGPTSVTVDWRGSGSGVRYGPTSAYGLTATGATPSPVPFSSSGPFWEAKISGLLPGVTYHYSVDGGPDHTFHPTAPTGASFTVYAEGDIGDAGTYPRVAVVQSIIAGGAPDFVLPVGDLTYANDHTQSCVDRHFNDVMVWSQDAAYMPAWGNHEWDKSTDDFRNYKGRFDFPNGKASPGAPSTGGTGEDWYWFDYGNTRFIAYPEPFSGAWADWNTKVKPIMADAQANPLIRFIVTFGHRPAYSSGHHPGDATLKGYLDGLGSTYSKYVLDLCGHSHNYERSYPQHGVTHVTVGTGGATLEEASGTCIYDGGCPPPSWTAFRAFHHGAVRLRFTPSSILVEGICGPAGDTGSNQNDITCSPGSVFDSFTIGFTADTGSENPQPLARLALEGVRPNPTRGAFDVQYQLGGTAPASLAMMDLAGRIVASRDLDELGPGTHHLQFNAPGGIAPGIYWLRLRQDGRIASSRIAVVR